MFKKKKKPQVSYRKDFAECEVCGCVVIRAKRNKGKSEVAIVDRPTFEFGHVDHHEVEVVKENYYCKTHKPKE